jgi:hypothetical protein
MDMEVDTRLLDELKAYITNCQTQLGYASSGMTSAVAAAGNSLEGKQYSLSVEETNASCGIINASANNLLILSQYLDRLNEQVQEYLRCKYEE